MIYHLGGFSLHVDSEDVQTASCIDQIWQALFHGTRIAGSVVQGDVRLRFTSYPLTRLPPTNSPSQKDGFEQCYTAESYYRACGSSALLLDLKNGGGIGYLAPDFWQQPLLQQRRFLLAAVIVLLRNCGGYSLHANGVAWSENSALIVGHSGSGKTTLTLGLLQAGWRCLGDDVLLLRTENNFVQAHALRRGFSCTAQTALQFPALADEIAIAPALSDYKKLLALETIWPDCFIPRCTPRFVFFPQIIDAQHSRLTALRPSQILCALLEQSLGLLLNMPLAQRQIALLNQLVRQIHGHRLYMGRDVYAEPERVADLLRAAMHTE